MKASVGIPSGWEEFTLGELFEFSNGVNADKSAYGDGLPFANVFEVVKNEALTDDLIPGRVNLPPTVAARYLVRHGDVLFNRTSETPEEVGLSSVYLGDSAILFGGFVFRGRPKSARLGVAYSKYALRSHRVRAQIVSRGQGAIRANIGQRDLKLVRVVLPPPDEQQSLARALADVDALIIALERLVEKKQAIYQGLMQQLLTGRSRFPGFTEPWRRRRIHELLVPRSERNVRGEALDVLSCTKHLGFVRSLDYFKAQVFSRDLSGYLVIHRGDIGYPSNHVEEGSIGVQEVTQRGLVSPIYVVMRPKEGVDTYFLQRLLKLDSFRQEFARVTNASVNRRGSLRWQAFSQIEVSIPHESEQGAISGVIRDAESAVATLRDQVDKAKAVKQGMLQELLTGRTQLPVMEGVA